MANLTFEQVLNDAVKKEVELLVEEELKKVEEKIKRETPRIVASLALTIFERISVDRIGREIHISAEWNPEGRRS